MRHLGVAAILLVAVIAAATEEQAGGNVTFVSAPTRVSKREAILLDSIPVESNHAYRRKSKIIYRRAYRPKSHSYHVQSKPKYGPPRNKYGPPTTARRPPKKHRGKHTKTKSSHQKSRPPKKHYSYPSMKQHRRPAASVYGVPKTYAAYMPQEPAGFGEPPADHFAVNNPKLSYGEPPTDSYGSPLSVRNQGQRYSYKPNSFGSVSYSNYAPDSQDSFPPNNHNSFAPSPQDSYSPSGEDSYSYTPEPSYAASAHSGKSQDSYSNYAPDPSYAASSHSQHSVGSTESNQDVVKESANTPPVRHTDQGSYSAPHNYNEKSPSSNFSPKPPVYSNHQSNYRPVQRKKKRIMDAAKSVSRPRKGPRGKKHSDDIIVGGQYAEPPGRYVPNFKPSAQMFTGGDSFVPGLESDEAATSYQSSYVNYKNSNMAFSPQNLNDAFSVTNK